jgi:asparagine synthetase B (glutamine-hydrolysing)
MHAFVCPPVMCGIFAIYDPQTPVTLESKSLAGRIEESLEYIAHRGPDATGVWVSDDASCGEYRNYSYDFVL